MYVVQLTKVNVPNIHMMCTSLLSCHWMLMGVVRYKWRGHAVWLSYELLMELEVATLYCFVSGSSIQAGAADDSEASFFPNVKDGNLVASPSVHIAWIF